MAHSWIPEIIRHQPSRELVLELTAPSVGLQRDVDQRLMLALESARVAGHRVADRRWKLVLPWQTRVYGFIVRDLDEPVDLEIGSSGLTVRCRCSETHTAHAIGFAGVLVFTVVAAVAAGWSTGPGVGAATLMAGSLWSVYTREMAMMVLERRLRRLLEDLTTALSPGR